MNKQKAETDTEIKKTNGCQRGGLWVDGQNGRRKIGDTGFQ